MSHLNMLRNLIKKIVKNSKFETGIELPESASQLSLFQTQADACKEKATCSVEQFETFLQWCELLNALVENDNGSPQTQRLIARFEDNISAFIREHFPFAEGVARCATNEKMVSYKNGHVHLLLKHGSHMRTNILLCDYEELQELNRSNILHGICVSASTKSRVTTSEHVLFVRESDVETQMTPFVQVKVDKKNHQLDIKSHMGVSSTTTYMPFSKPSPPVTRASCGGLTWFDSASALEKCSSFEDTYFRDYKVMVRIFKDV